MANPYVQQKRKQNREWLVGLPNKTQVTEFSVLRDTSADKTAPPVLYGEIPNLRNQNEYRSEKLSPRRDLIGWEHPISLHHRRTVIRDCHHSHSPYVTEICFFCHIRTEWYDWMNHILLPSHFAFVFVIRQGQFHPFFNENKKLILFCFRFCCT